MASVVASKLVGLPNKPHGLSLPQLPSGLNNKMEHKNGQGLFSNFRFCPKMVKAPHAITADAPTEVIYFCRNPFLQLLS